jgi:hypothetical protein
MFSSEQGQSFQERRAQQIWKHESFVSSARTSHNANECVPGNVTHHKFSNMAYTQRRKFSIPAFGGLGETSSNHRCVVASICPQKVNQKSMKQSALTGGCAVGAPRSLLSAGSLLRTVSVFILVSAVPVHSNGITTGLSVLRTI